MPPTDSLAGTFPLADDLTVHRMGFGAMQLPGEGVWGPPRDHDEAVAVLRTAVELGIDHIDTAGFYGDHVSDDLIRKALHPYPDALTIVTKVGARRGEDASWIHDLSKENLITSVHEDIDHLGVEALDVVNLRAPGLESPDGTPLGEAFSVLAALQDEGLIRHLGVSTVTAEQIAECQAIAPVVCVQNLYNLARRGDDALIDSLAGQGVAYVPYFPLGGFSPLQHDRLDLVAEQVGATPMQVALAWLLQRSPNIVLIPGTSSVDHLKDNVAAAALTLEERALHELDAIAR
jgi:pyridoxine 4-dehydrogenase